MKVSEPETTGYRAPEPGTYIARCIRLIDLGTQTSEFQGQTTSKRQALVGWELPSELLPDGEAEGQPYFIAKFYTLSLHEKSNLRHDLVNWRGKEFSADELQGFELKAILGAPAMLTITKSDAGRPRVTGVTNLPKGTKCPEQVNPSIYFSLEPSEFDGEAFEALTEGVRNMIENSPEYDKLMCRVPREEFEDVSVDDDGIPF